MKDSISRAKLRTPKHPNFALVVLFAGIAFIVMFILAYLVLGMGAKKLLPKTPNPHPTSYLVHSPSQIVDA
ncbi:MAG: hypothetical protein ACRD3K_07540 [Edaphobacter sp.]